MGMIAEFRIPGLLILTAPWYTSPSRISYLWAYFGATYAALGVVFGLKVLADLLIRRFAIRRSAAVGAGSFVVASAFIAAAVVPSERVASRAYTENSLIGSDQRAAFAWLARRTPAGDRVLNQFADGSAWMGPLSGVTPLFQAAVDEGPGMSEIWGDRWYLLTHAADLGSDSRAQEAVRKWRIRYVYLNDRHFFEARADLLSASAISSSPAYKQVWSRAGVTIFQVVTR
jgi:hypothetical protein